MKLEEQFETFKEAAVKFLIVAEQQHLDLWILLMRFREEFEDGKHNDDEGFDEARAAVTEAWKEQTASSDSGHAEAVQLLHEATHHANLLPAAVTLLRSLENVFRPLQEMWRLIPRPVWADNDIALRKDGLSEMSDAIAHLNIVGSLGRPIGFTQWSEWHVAADIIEQFSSESTWHNRRKAHPRDIEKHPQSGDRQIRITRRFAELNKISLPEFGGKPQ